VRSAKSKETGKMGDSWPVMRLNIPGFHRRERAVTAEPNSEALGFTTQHLPVTIK
jgi:hypothetical protein